MKNAGIGLLIAALPWLVSGVFSAASFPPLLAYALFPGRGVFVLVGAVVVFWALVGRRLDLGAMTSPVEALMSEPFFPVIALLLVAVVAFARVPQEEKEADAFGGDEPKYLRIAFSLLRDTDADIGGGRTVSPDLSTRLQQVRNLALTTRDAIAHLFKPVAIPEGHVWNAGNWTVRGLDGGLYHLQPPGLPALVAVALGLGETFLPERDPGLYVFVLLAVVWTLAARELWLLTREATDDPVSASLVTGLVFLSAPVYVGGYQLFPESLALFLFPWLLRRLRASNRSLRPLSALACGLVSGWLLWIHPKLTIVALFFAAMALLRPGTPWRSKLLFGAAFGLVAFTALLYCHQISGLFRPEGLYIRQAEEYVGAPNPFSARFLAGLVKSLVGGRDGLILFAPILALGLLRLPREERSIRPLVELGLLFLTVWMTSAVHDGASLGSPARLMAPVAFVPAFFLLRTLREGPEAKFQAAALLLFIFGCVVTYTVTSDWRRNVNPYRTMFTNPATNFEASLPGNSFSDDAYVRDLEKAALILTLLIAGVIGLRKTRASRSEWEPSLFGLGAIAALVALAFGLDALSGP